MGAREELRNWLLKKGAYLTVFFLVFALLIIALAPIYNNLIGTDPSVYRLNLGHGLFTLCVVAFAGMTGAFVSMQQRIQTAPSQGDPLYNLSTLTHGSFGIFLSPLSGAIFAIILYMFFAGGLVKGDIFPAFVTDVGKHVIPLPNFLEVTGPMGGNNYGKLLIWSFIAGFAERFVPDKLNKLISDDKTAKAKKAGE